MPASLYACAAAMDIGAPRELHGAKTEIEFSSRSACRRRLE
jgi:hypothetical protein